MAGGWIVQSIFLSFYINFYWNIVDLQWCFSFRGTAKWIRYIYIWFYIYIKSPFFRFFSHIGYYKILSRVPMLDHGSLLVIYLIYSRVCTLASLVAQSVKSPPAVQETWVRSLGQENPMERGAWQDTVYRAASIGCDLSTKAITRI